MAKKQESRDHIHDHAGRNDGHPLPHFFGRVRPGILSDLVAGLLTGIHVVLAEHLHVTAKRQRRQGVFGFAFLTTPDNRADADAEAFHMHIAPFGNGKVAQFMKEDHKAQPQQNCESVPQFAQAEGQGDQIDGVKV